MTDKEHNGAFSTTFAQKKKWKVDPDLWRALLAVLPDQQTRIVDIGAGAGHYVEALSLQGHLCAGIDGTPDIQRISGGRVQQWDLTQPVGWNPPAQWAMFIEVGEHIPAQYEHIALDNVARAATDGLIVSWAYPGQRGRDHINCREEAWVVRQLGERGWQLDAEKTALAKQTAGGGWKRKLCVFRPETEDEKKARLISEHANRKRNPIHVS